MVYLSNILFSIPLNHFFADLAKCIIFDAEMYLRWYFSCNNFKSLPRFKKTKRYCNCFMLFYSSWSEVPSCGTSYELMFDKFFFKHKVTCPPTFDSTVKVRYNVSACLPLGNNPRYWAVRYDWQYDWECVQMTEGGSNCLSCNYSNNFCHSQFICNVT